MEYHLYSTIYGVPFMEYHLWSTIYEVPFMEYHLWSTIISYLWGWYNKTNVYSVLADLLHRSLYRGTCPGNIARSFPGISVIHVLLTDTDYITLGLSYKLVPCCI